MAESLLLSLKAVGPPQDDSLPSLIQQINNQRGSFRNVTEEDLQQEITNGHGDRVDSGDESAQESEKQSNDDLQSRRQEILVQAQ